MRVLLAPFGSRGDVQPMLALALALTWRRHQVTVVAPPDFARWISSLGLVGHAVGPPIAELVSRSMDGIAGARWAMRALPAMIGEHHARRTFALASAYAGRPLGPAPLPELLAAPVVCEDAVSQLAVESLVDGCLNEGVAAAIAAAAARAASDTAVRTTLEVIAKDEASHRELAWDVLAWCASVSDRARESVASSVQQLPRMARFGDCAPELSSHGRLPAARQRELFERVRAEVVERAQRLLGVAEAA